MRKNLSWALNGAIFYVFSQWVLLDILAKLGGPTIVGRYTLGLAMTAPIVLLANLQLRTLLASDVKEMFPFSAYAILRLLTSLGALLLICGLAACLEFTLDQAVVICLIGLAKVIESGSDITYGLMQKHERMDLESVGLVGGNNYPDFKGSVPRWLHERWNTPNEFGKSIGQLSVSDFGQGIYEIDARFIWGCNFAIRRSLLDSAKGFHPDGFPKELLKFRGDGESYVADHVGRSSFRVVFKSKVSVLHLVTPERMTREYFVRREYAQGVSDSYKDIRDASGLSGSFSMLLRRRVRIARAQIRRFSNRLKHELSSEQKEWLDLEREMEKSYRKGYGFHRRSVRSDSGLLDWVLKDSYYD